MVIEDLTKEWVNKTFPSRKIPYSIQVCKIHGTAMSVYTTARKIDFECFTVSATRYSYCKECKENNKLNSGKSRGEISFKSYFLSASQS